MQGKTIVNLKFCFKLGEFAKKKSGHAEINWKLYMYYTQLLWGLTLSKLALITIIITTCVFQLMSYARTIDDT